MPEWLLNDENYIPKQDKDTFINRSILSFLNLVSRVRVQSNYSSNKYSVNPTLKVAFTFLLIILLSVSKNFMFVIIINIYIIVLLSLMNADSIIKVLKLSIIGVFFTFVILLPSILMGRTASSIMLLSKVFATIMGVNILSHSTRWSQITNALKTFFVADIFIFVLDITIKYIVMLGQFSLDMLYSLRLRSVGKNKDKYASLGGIAGTMFIKSTEMAQEMYHAMECRGFTGEYIINRKAKFTFIDFIYVIVNLVLILIFIYLGW